jgi:hypothetical protein
MDDQQALAIVTALAHGANPQTGEVFEADSVYQSSDVIRALFVAQRALEARLPATTTAPRASQLSKASSSNSTRNDGWTNRGSNSNQQRPVPTRNEPHRQARATNVGKPWSGEEDAQLLKAFDNKQPIAEIARTHARTPSGICARLEKHGRLQPAGV